MWLVLLVDDVITVAIHMFNTTQIFNEILSASCF